MWSNGALVNRGVDDVNAVYAAATGRNLRLRLVGYFDYGFLGSSFDRLKETRYNGASSGVYTPIQRLGTTFCPSLVLALSPV